MPYMGAISSGSSLAVRLASGTGNKAPVSLTVGISAGSIEAGAPQLVIAPGTSRELVLTAGWSGMIRIHIEFERDGESGELEVRVNGTARDAARVWGETWWAYSVEAPVLAGLPAGGGYLGATDSRHAPRASLKIGAWS